MRAMRMFVALIVVGGILSVAPAAAPDSATAALPRTGAATREVPATYTPKVPIAVTIDVWPSGDTQAWAVEEVVPDGWRVSAISAEGHWDQAANTVRWGPFFDSAVKSLKYSLTAPAGTTGAQELKGTASFDGEDVVVAGKKALQSTPVTQPGR
jgi:hypothetical protein